MRLIFLGTGTSMGVPVIACPCVVCHSGDKHDQRLRTSALLQVEGKNILFDIGPDFRQQMLRSGTKRIDAILVTHAHRDHVAGLDDVRPLNYMQQQPMDIYLNVEARVALERDYRYIFAPHEYPGLPEVELHTVDASKDFRAAGLDVTPIAAMHKNLPVLGYRIGPMAYITDASRIVHEEMRKLEGVKVLVINALRKEKHFSHYSLPEALDVIATVRPERAYLTHISHEMGLHETVDAELPEGVSLAYDGLEVEI